jgi:MFS family permease
MLALANLLLCMSVTMLIPTLPLWMCYIEGITTFETGMAMACLGIGMLLPGFLCSFLIQHYRRNIVFVCAAFMLALSILSLTYLHHAPLWVLLLTRLFQGISYGLALIVLSSTLVIDTCDSHQRTEANHSVTWFGRFALSLGPLLGLLLYQQMNMPTVFIVAASCCVAAAVLVLTVHFPFRVPSEYVFRLSLDRFLLVEGLPMLLHLFPLMIAVGMLFSLPLSLHFYALLMVGFLLSLMAQQFVFPDADLKSEIVSGLLLIIAGELVMLFIPTSPFCSPLIGTGLGIVGARYLLFFIKLSRHCKRGTAQSTFLMGWEVGVALGMGLGLMLFDGDREMLIICSLAIVVLALILYVVFVHSWFIAHKNR